MPDQLTETDLALIEEAARKSALVWLVPTGPGGSGSAGSGGTSGSGGPGAQAVWHVWHDGAVTVVAGGGEQPLPGHAAPGRTVEVSIRSKDSWGRLVRWLAQVEAVAPGTPEWDAAADALHAERLNLAEGDAWRERWARTSVILRMKPLGTGLVPPDGGSGAARPAPSPATTVGLQPRMIGGLPKGKKK